MEFVKDKKGQLISRKQFESSLNRLSLFQYWLHKIHYNCDMRHAHKEIFRALKKIECFAIYAIMIKI